MVFMVGQENPAFDPHQMVFGERTLTANESLSTEAVSAPRHDHSSSGCHKRELSNFADQAMFVFEISSKCIVTVLSTKFHLASGHIKFGNCSFWSETINNWWERVVSGKHCILGLHFSQPANYGGNQIAGKWRVHR
jgi:hypothetical protein